MPTLRTLLPYLKPYRWRVLLVLVSILVVTAAGLLAPWLVRELVRLVRLSEGDLAGATRGVGGLALALLGVYALRSLGQFINFHVSHTVAFGVCHDLREAVYAQLQRFSPAYYSERQTGEVASRVLKDTDNLEPVIADVMYDFVVSALLAVGIVVILLSLEPTLTLLAFLPVPFVAAGVWLLRRPINRAFEAEAARVGEVSALVQDNLSGVREIQVFGREHHEGVRCLRPALRGAVRAGGVKEQRSPHSAAEPQRRKTVNKAMNKVTKRLLPGVLALLVYLAASGPGLAQSPQVEVLEETAEYRVIKHLAGETRIPANPERIAALHDAVSEPLIAMGIKPVGAASYDPAFPSFLRPHLEGAAYLGTNLEPNVEATLAAEPDLIIMAFDERVDRGFYNQLSLIAPTVLIPNGFSDIRQGLRDLGTVLGMSREAEAVIESYDQDIARARETFQRIVNDQTVALLRIQGRDIRLVGNGEFGGPVIYNDLGLEPAPLVRSLAWGENYVSISLETVPEIQADHLFFFVGHQDDEGRELLRELEQSPLWRNLPAFRTGRAYPVNYDTWVWNGIIGNSLIIEQALAAITGESE